MANPTGVPLLPKQLTDLTDVSGTTGTGSTVVLSASPTLTGTLTVPDIQGGTGAGDDLGLSSTSNATKGNINLGTASTYDEVNDRLGLSELSPNERFQADGNWTMNADGFIYSYTTGAAGSVRAGFQLDGTNQQIEIYTATNLRATWHSDGGLVIGSPTGGSQGAGTGNASAFYDDSVLLTHFVTELRFRGRVVEFLQQMKDAGRNPGTYQILSIDETEAHADSTLGLPTMPSEEEFMNTGPGRGKGLGKTNSKMSVGRLIVRLWETAETQAIHIFELNRRLKVLEAA